MHIKYVINQHHYEKIKYYPHLIIKFNIYIFFQYIKKLWLFFLFGDKEQKLSTLPYWHLLAFFIRANL
jgi:hypothetical protein